MLHQFINSFFRKSQLERKKERFHPTEKFAFTFSTTFKQPCLSLLALWRILTIDNCKQWPFSKRPNLTAKRGCRSRRACPVGGGEGHHALRCCCQGEIVWMPPEAFIPVVDQLTCPLKLWADVWVVFLSTRFFLLSFCCISYSRL